MISQYPPIIEVDDYGNIVGPINYEDAHPQDQETGGVRHLTSNVLVFEDESCKRLLLTQRSKDISRSSTLNISVGGHGIWLNNEDRAQTPLETALMEMQEELFSGNSLPNGLKIDYVNSFRKDLRMNDLEYVHFYRTFFSGPFNPNAREVSRAFFEDIDFVLDDLLKNPCKYVKSAPLYLCQFFVSTNRPLF